MKLMTLAAAAASPALQAVVWALYAGLVLASVLMVLVKRSAGKIVRALERAEAFSEKDARTLEELEVGTGASVRRQLRHGTTLRRYVMAAEEETARREPRKEGKAERALRRILSLEKKETYDYDYSVQRWYLDGEKRHEASVRYESRGSNWQMVVIAAVLLLAVAVAALYLLPQLGTMYNDLLNLG